MPVDSDESSVEIDGVPRMSKSHAPSSPRPSDESDHKADEETRASFRKDQKLLLAGVGNFSGGSKGNLNAIDADLRSLEVEAASVERRRPTPTERSGDEADKEDAKEQKPKRKNKKGKSVAFSDTAGGNGGKGSPSQDGAKD